MSENFDQDVKDLFAVIRNTFGKINYNAQSDAAAVAQCAGAVATILNTWGAGGFSDSAADIKQRIEICSDILPGV
jgi:hypothetical protein